MNLKGTLANQENHIVTCQLADTWNRSNPFLTLWTPTVKFLARVPQHLYHSCHIDVQNRQEQFKLFFFFFNARLTRHDREEQKEICAKKNCQGTIIVLVIIIIIKESVITMKERFMNPRRSYKWFIY